MHRSHTIAGGFAPITDAERATRFARAVVSDLLVYEQLFDDDAKSEAIETFAKRFPGVDNRAILVQTLAERRVEKRGIRLDRFPMANYVWAAIQATNAYGEPAATEAFNLVMS